MPDGHENGVELASGVEDLVGAGDAVGAVVGVVLTVGLGNGLAVAAGKDVAVGVAVDAGNPAPHPAMRAANTPMPVKFRNIEFTSDPRKLAANPPSEISL